MTKSFILIPEPQLWLGGGSVDGLGFKLFSEQVGHNGADGRSYGCPMHLFMILTLEEEIGVFKTEFLQCCDVLY